MIGKVYIFRLNKKNMLITGMASTQSVMSHLHNKEVSLIGDSIKSDLISP